MHLTDGLLLAHYEEGCCIICEEVSWLPIASQFDPHLSAELVKHGYSMALTYSMAQLGGTSQSSLQRIHLDPRGHIIFYQVGEGCATS